MPYALCPMPRKKKRDKSATADQSRLPFLKERRTLEINIALIENKCQLVIKIFLNNF
jgi:hypothetical protein